MSKPSRSRVPRRTHLVLVAESLLVVAILCFASAVPPARALDPTADPSPAVDPSPAAAPSPVADPSPSPNPSVVPCPTDAPDPSATADPSAGPDPTLAPDPSAPPDPAVTPDPSATPDPAVTLDPTLAPDPSALPCPTDARLRVDHFWVDATALSTGLVVPGAVDAPAVGVDRGRIYVVRFQVVNGAKTPVTLRPVLEFGSGVVPETWAVVPAVDPMPGIPFYASANVLQGERPGMSSIPVPGLRLAKAVGLAGRAFPGVSHVGVNSGSMIRLAAHGFTEVAFTIRATAAATWLATYSVRLADGTREIAGAGVATLVLRDSPPVVLTPGQRTGIAASDPYPIYRLAVPGPLAPEAETIPLTLGLQAAAQRDDVLLGPSFISPHDSTSLISDTCAACHSAHKATNSTLLVRLAPQSTLCLACHDGSGAVANIAAQYADPTIPANDPTTDSYYSHAATGLSNHTSDRDPGEFQGVLNRHTTCTDCHQPHRADASLAVETSAGWTASGALIGASGVAVANGPAGSSPTYTRTDASALEYQLCFKCHSGFTQLNPQMGDPSTWALDKAVELNPANLSYHPVEAPGTNATAQMGRSLSGTSPYKLWIFTTGSTVRCVSCHGDARLGNPDLPPAAGARLAPHTVANRGMLIANLSDRSLKGPSEAYAAADFALCFACHAEAPFVDTSQNPRLDTNYPLHGMHVAGIASYTGPSGETVDQDGAGHGNAICAECHFRTHGTTYAVDGQVPGSRLVNFAPNVQPYQGTDPAYQGLLKWDASTHSCTLTCHGVDHKAWSY